MFNEISISSVNSEEFRSSKLYSNVRWAARSPTVKFYFTVKQKEGNKIAIYKMAFPLCIMAPKCASSIIEHEAIMMKTDISILRFFMIS